MTLLAEFADAETMLRAARAAKSDRYRLIDAYSPVPVEGIAEMLGASSSAVRVAMFVGGFSVAACAYALEWYSAVISYPINSGGRPLHSWPAFMMFPFSIGILSAAICGLVAFFILTGLPRLHHPLFDAESFDRVSQDRFALELAQPRDQERRATLAKMLTDGGAISLREIGT